MPEFIPGLLLDGRFYREIVRPILDQVLPDLPHSAGLIGFGSDVLGFDDDVSADHHWGPRVLLFVGEAHQREHAVRPPRRAAAPIASKLSRVVDELRGAPCPSARFEQDDPCLR